MSLKYNKKCLLLNPEKIDWPKNHGCLHKSEEVLLSPLKLTKYHYKFSKKLNPRNLKIVWPGLIDRFGPTKGFFFGNAGNTWLERSLPWFNNDKSCKKEYSHYLENIEYHQYEILKPFYVHTCSILHSFGAIGGGTQYWCTKSVKYLLTRGFIKEVVDEYYHPNFD